MKLSLAFVLAAFSPLAGAADPSPPAPARLGLCVACHGEDGRSRTPAAPHIGGQNEMYLVGALTRYREGRREGDVMNSIAGTLSEADIAALASWYAGRTWPAIAVPVP